MVRELGYDGLVKLQRIKEKLRHIYPLLYIERWTELWLKEGFTSYVECLGADFVSYRIEMWN